MNLSDIDVRSNEPALEQPMGRDDAKEHGRKDKSKITKDFD